MPGGSAVGDADIRRDFEDDQTEAVQLANDHIGLLENGGSPEDIRWHPEYPAEHLRRHVHPVAFPLDLFPTGRSLLEHAVTRTSQPGPLQYRSRTDPRHPGRHAKVTNLERTRIADQYVGRFQIKVYNSVRVDMVHPVRKLADDFPDPSFV